MVNKGRGIGVWGKILSYWVVVSIAMIFLYEYFINGVVLEIPMDYLFVIGIAFVLVVVGSILWARSCKRTPRGGGRMRGMFG